MEINNLTFQKNKLYYGDCLEIMKIISDKSVRLIFADLPYEVTKLGFDIIIPFDKLWKEFERIIMDDGNIVLTASQPFTSALVMSNLKLFRYEFIWEKGQATNPMMCKKQIMKKHESVLVFYKKKSVYNPQMEIGNPYKGFESSNNKTIGEVYGNLKSKHKENTGTRYPTSIVKFSREYGLHPVQKPIKLIEYIIKTFSNEGDLVLDTTAGNCTTAIATINTRRDWVCIEKDENYFNIDSERIKQKIYS